MRNVLAVMTPRPFLLGCLLLSAAAAAPAADDAKVSLRPRLAPGQYRLSVESGVSQTATVAGKPQPTRATTRAFDLKLVAGVPDDKGDTPLAITFTRFAQRISAGEAASSYDSAGPADEQDAGMAAVYAPLLDARIEASVDADGRVVAVTGLNKLWNEQAREHRDLRLIFRQMTRELGDNFIRRTLAMMTAPLPAKPVSPGDTWEATVELDLPYLGPTPSAATCVLKSVDDSGAAVALTGEHHLPRTARASIMGMDMVIEKADFTRTGELRFDTAAALPKSASHEHSGTMSVQVFQPGKPPAPMTLKAVSKTTATLTPVGDGDADGADAPADPNAPAGSR